MTYEVYRYIFIGAAIICGVLLVASILLFVFLKIPEIIGDLSGTTAKKAIKNIREQNEKTGNKAHKISHVNRERGKLTDKISRTGHISRNSQNSLDIGVETSKIPTSQFSDKSNVTTVLSNDSQETAVLSDDVLTTVSENVSSLGGDETSVLNVQSGQTTVLEVAQEYKYDTAFSIELEISFVHTDEIIAWG